MTHRVHLMRTDCRRTRCDIAGAYEHCQSCDTKQIEQFCRDIAEGGTERPRETTALDEWVTLMKPALVDAVSDSPRPYRAVGSARAGLRALFERKDSAPRRLGASMRERLQACLLTTTPAGLLDRLKWHLRSTRLN